MHKKNINDDWIRHFDGEGEYHCDDGPAYETATSVGWLIHGKLHRLDGPAYIRPDGHQEWWVDGKLHRIDGPAVIWADGNQEWWINGVQITDHATVWIKENDFPDHTLWTDAHKIMFRLAFAGIRS